jgi:hypothetical protein
MSLKTFCTQLYSHVAHECEKVIQEAHGLAEKADSTIVQAWISRAKKYGPILAETSKKVLDVIKRILTISLYIITAAGVFYYFPTLAIAGVALAGVWPDQMNAAITRIVKVWESLPWVLKIAAHVYIPLEFPSFCFIAAPFVAGKVCLYLEEKAKAWRPPQELHHGHTQRPSHHRHRIRQLPHSRPRVRMAQVRA